MTSRPTDPRLSRFEKKRKDGTRYVYERETRYNPEKGYTETLRTSLLYKITASGDRIATNGSFYQEVNRIFAIRFRYLLITE